MSTRWPRRFSTRAAVALPLVAALVGCGTSTPAGSDSAGGADKEQPSATASEPTPEQETGREPSRAAMGVDQGTWPGELAEAEELFDRMPATLAGADLRRPRMFGSAAGVRYRRGNAAPFAWVMEADADVPDAPTALAVMFGMTMSCAKGSYAGTIPQSPYGGVPDTDRSGAYDPDGAREPWWFACTIDGAEGDAKFSGHALGWASGDLGWLTVTKDRATTRELVAALRRAR